VTNDEVSFLKSQFNIDSLEELLETGYIIVNEDGIRLPQPAEESDISIALRFIQNPA
jgi:hypothetical protein